MNSVLKMTDLKSLQFVELCKQECVLWNPGHKMYKCREARLAAMHRIAINMQIPDFGPIQVQHKFKNLRSSYCQELKKIRRSKKLGGKPYKPTVVWFTVMDSFLRPFIQQKDSTKKEFAVTLAKKHNETEQESPALPVAVKVEPEYQFVSSGPSSVDGNHESMSDDAADFLLPNVQIRSEEPLTRADDSFDHYGKYMTSVLRELPKHIAYKLQQQFSNILLEAQLQAHEECDAYRPNIYTGTIKRLDMAE